MFAILTVLYIPNENPGSEFLLISENQLRKLGNWVPEIILFLISEFTQ